MASLKRGKKTREWDRVRAELKIWFASAGITRCEKCGSDWALSFAHRLKRRLIATEDELRTVALLCQPCHERIEYGGDMFREVTEIIMSRSNPQTRQRPEPINDLQYVFTFGRYKGFTLDDVMWSDPQYLVWAHKNLDQFELSWDLLEKAENGGREEEK